MVAHYHGQVLNLSELARSLGVDQKTAKHYLDILQGAYVVRVLPPWFENLAKRQRKSPKVYVRDSGLHHSLLDLETPAQIRSHPKYGASWEGFALEQTLLAHGEKQSHFWATQRGAELDLLLIRGGRRYGFEFKCHNAPTMTRSLHIALEDLGLERAYLVYPGVKRYPVDESVEAIPLDEVGSVLR